MKELFCKKISEVNWETLGLNQEVYDLTKNANHTEIINLARLSNFDEKSYFLEKKMISLIGKEGFTKEEALKKAPEITHQIIASLKKAQYVRKDIRPDDYKKFLFVQGLTNYAIYAVADISDLRLFVREHYAELNPLFYTSFTEEDFKNNKAFLKNIATKAWSYYHKAKTCPRAYETYNPKIILQALSILTCGLTPTQKDFAEWFFMKNHKRNTFLTKQEREILDCCGISVLFLGWDNKKTLNGLF